MKNAFVLVMLLAAILVALGQRQRTRGRHGNRRRTVGPSNRRFTFRHTYTWSKLVHANDTTIQSETCGLPASPGPCDGQYAYWHYDNQLNTCHAFLWSGCGGNSNRFASREECSRLCVAESVQDTCAQPMAAGSCDLELSYWYHDNETNTCHEFLWSGCGGNNNRFSSAAECRLVCGAETEPTEEPVVPDNIAQECRVGPDSGSCSTSETRWFHDVTDATCKTFTYEGTGGNDNNFATRGDCETACAPVEEDPFDYSYSWFGDDTLVP